MSYDQAQQKQLERFTLIDKHELETIRKALVAADAAINPPDRPGISLDIWNGRLKAATILIRGAIALVGQPSARGAESQGGDK